MAMYTSSYINKALTTLPEGPRHDVQTEGQKTMQPAVARLVEDHAACCCCLGLLSKLHIYLQTNSGPGRAICQAVTGILPARIDAYFL